MTGNYRPERTPGALQGHAHYRCDARQRSLPITLVSPVCRGGRGHSSSRRATSASPHSYPSEITALKSGTGYLHFELTGRAGIPARISYQWLWHRRANGDSTAISQPRELRIIVFLRVIELSFVSAGFSSSEKINRHRPAMTSLGWTHLTVGVSCWSQVEASVFILCVTEILPCILEDAWKHIRMFLTRTESTTLMVPWSCFITWIIPWNYLININILNHGDSESN